MCPRIWRASPDRCQFHVCSGHVIVLSRVVGTHPPNPPLIRVEEQLVRPEKKPPLALLPKRTVAVRESSKYRTKPCYGQASNARPSSHSAARYHQTALGWSKLGWAGAVENSGSSTISLISSSWGWRWLVLMEVGSLYHHHHHPVGESLLLWYITASIKSS